MKTLKNTAALLAFAGIISGSLIGPQAHAQAFTHPSTFAAATSHERHPELRRALRTLERVEAQLRSSARDFGGHRAAAADLCHQAEAQIKLALQDDKH